LRFRHLVTLGGSLGSTSLGSSLSSTGSLALRSSLSGTSLGVASLGVAGLGVAGLGVASLGVASLGVASSSLGVASSSLGVASSSLGVASASLGVASASLGVTGLGTDLVGEENSVEGVGLNVASSTVGHDWGTLEGEELTSEGGGVGEWGLGGVLGAEGWGVVATAGLAEANGVGNHEARSLVELRDKLGSGREGGCVGDGTSWQSVSGLSIDRSARRGTGGRDEGVVATGLVGRQK